MASVFWQPFHETESYEVDCKVDYIGVDFEIQFKPGLENKATYALSRKIMFVALSVVQTTFWEQLDKEVQEDSKLVSIIQGMLQEDKAIPS